MISVLTPSYQYGRFLEEAIWSVEGQSGEIEHVVQDAMSTDATESVLARHPRLRAVREPDSGQSDALARALARSSGEWVGWLNADEFYLPEAFEVIAPAMRDPRVDVVLGDAVMVDEAGRFLRLLPTYVPRGPSLAYYGPVLASCATFVRREWLERFLWDTELRWVMDWDLWLRLRGAGARFCHVSATLAAYRVHAGQVTQGQAACHGRNYVGCASAAAWWTAGGASPSYGWLGR